MARKIFKRWTVEGQKLLANGSLSALGDRIHDPNLWHLNRHSVSRAFLAGLFAGFAFILFPGQMLVAAVLAIWLRANLPIAVGLVWVSNPVTSPPILYAALKIGLVFIPVTVDFDVGALLSLDWGDRSLIDEIIGILHLLKEAWRPILLGSFFIGTALGFSGYFIVQL
ncbi:MAG: DUF2062 domain-containing protein, partial [Pseudomonadales bacterium]|nr:DUF2062 domain-containing protein [Pseudomonadales bacterium]